MCQISFRQRAQLPFCILYTVLTFAGALMKVDFVWTAGETLNYLMAAPNMLALLVLNREVAGNSFCLKPKNRDACLKYFIFAFRYLLFPDFDAK